MSVLLQLVPMESVFQQINKLSANVVSTSQGVAIAVAVVIFLMVGISCRFKASTMIITFLCCSFGVWAVFNMNFGKQSMSDTIGGNNAAPAAGRP